MKTQLYSHNYAYELLQNEDLKNIYTEIMIVCNDCPLPIYKDKSIAQHKLYVVQQFINSYFDIRLSDMGWKSQPLVTSQNSDDKLKADFMKTFETNNIYSPKKTFTVVIEVELGNNASYYRDLYKFLLSYSQNTADFCVLIVPTKEIATKIDSGVIEFEKTKRELKDVRINFPIPILVIGLETDNENIWNTKDNIQIDFSGKNYKNKKAANKIFVESYINYKKGLRNQPLMYTADFEKLAEKITTLENENTLNFSKINNLKKEIGEIENNIANGINDNKKTHNQLKNKKEKLCNLNANIKANSDEIKSLKLGDF